MDAGRRATIVDVAREAEVSIKTVSRVFNDAPNVRPHTRDRVVKAATALNYQPNVVAQGLVGRRSYLLGLFYENPSPNYVVELQRGAVDRLRGERYRLIVLPVEQVAQVADNILSFVRSAALDGIILTPPASDHPAILEHLSAARFPFVRIAPTRSPEIQPRNITDDVAAARAMTEYLISLGHRRIGVIKGDPSHPSSEARLLGFSLALASAHLPPRLDDIDQGMFTFESGFEAARRLLARKDRPTAIFAQNDDMAAGAIMAAHDLGIDVPGELSIAGFDDSAIANIVWPRITTIHQPVFDMARSATDTLLAMLEKNPYPDVVDHPFTLIPRQSTGPAPR
ncbi:MULTISPECIES: LacI family DNA-binding transcriptional regulator [Sphingomonadales]|uniref:Alanine racemase n=2 Tax=Edaphosphingomonas TaxID=3423724 RepID=A0A2T4HLP6_9SPHN|nr:MULTISPECIES: LacI family DNA-binding transcriptional regulator [Sphingomonas]AGH49910.1 LacI family transcriptional regulator [Sphingomonas sp. MM-1]MDX3883228.1 LacI family DNA-binding transcriptional regulator [Sphingomonas sp.]OHT18268.1 Catabolite control protein A [Sphingomonas haloaromaticamans]PTD16734.1 alanine racemase [Sphingomonas fennica]